MKFKFVVYFFVLILLIALKSSSVNADWISFSGAENAPNIAEIYVNQDHVKVKLEVYVDNLSIFEELIPDDMFSKPIPGRPSQAERLRVFSKRVLQLKTQTGRNLSVRLKLVEPRMRKERLSPFAGMINPYTRQPIPGPPADKRVLYAELIYPFKTKPKELTIIPPTDERGMSKATIGFITYHKGVLLNTFGYLSEPSKLRLDWNDPWYSSFDKKALKRFLRGAVMSFLYIEPYEVRHEVMARVKELEAWMDLGLRGREYIEVDEFEPLRKRIGEFLLKRNRVLIDGKELRPILDRTAFIEYSLTSSRFLVKPERLPLATATFGVVIAYITDGIPKEVTVDWELFSKRIQQVPTNAIDPAGPFPSYVTPDDNVFKWTNFLKKYEIPQMRGVDVSESLTKFSIPLGTILCLAAIWPIVIQIRKRKGVNGTHRLQYGVAAALVVFGLLIYPFTKISIAKPSAMVTVQDDDARDILYGLLKNVYRAFDFREESDIYDKLALSVNGDLLTDIYLQNRKSFEVQRAGGAQAKVKQIEIQDTEMKRLPDRPLGLALTSKWTAMGTVGHWGHIHSRMNQYEAIINIEPVDGVWKITGLELLEEKRIDPYAKKPQKDRPETESK